MIKQQILRADTFELKINCTQNFGMSLFNTANLIQTLDKNVTSRVVQWEPNFVCTE